MATLGLPPHPIPSSADRAPAWPAGVVGAITHTRDYCAAATARDIEVRSVGIDAERHKQLDPGVRRMICSPDEEEHCARLPAGTSWPVVLFSAKETVYKVWYPIVGSWLDFHDAAVELDPSSGTFTARISPAKVAVAPVADPPTVIVGRFAIESDLVRTAAALTAR